MIKREGSLLETPFQHSPATTRRNLCPDFAPSDEDQRNSFRWTSFRCAVYVGPTLEEWLRRFALASDSDENERQWFAPVGFIKVGSGGG